MPVTIGASLAFCGRPLWPDNLELIRQLIRDFPRLTLTEFSRTLCERMQGMSFEPPWRSPQGILPRFATQVWSVRASRPSARPPGHGMCYYRQAASEEARKKQRYRL